MTTRAAVAALAAGAALAMTACTPADDSELSTQESDDPVIWSTWTTDQPAMRALMQATLVLEDGCLRGDGGLIAIPRAYGTWNADDQTLTYGDKTYAPGDVIAAGGGGGAITEDMTIPEGCDAKVGDAIFWIQDSSLG